jgi:hypothetical protein
MILDAAIVLRMSMRRGNDERISTATGIIRRVTEVVEATEIAMAAREANKKLAGP